MKQIISLYFYLLLLAFPGFTLPVQAVEPGEVLKDPVLEARARDISAGLRCLVCQNQSIDDSNAGLAKDLRLLVRERLVAGDSNEQTIGYIVSKYGEYVLLKPKFALHTVVLWLGPFVLLFLSIIVLLRKRSNRPVSITETALSDEEKQKLQDMIK